VILSMIVTLGAGAVGPNEPGGSFTDEDGAFHEGAIEAIAAANITLGCNQGNYLYCPGGAVNRGQIAAFLDRALNLSPAAQDFFTDDNNSIFEDSINSLAAAGITQDCGPSQYCPDQVMTRGQMAGLLTRALSLPAANQDFFGDDNGTFFEADINALAQVRITT
jgi:hypothetical protein